MSVRDRDIIDYTLYREHGANCVEKRITKAETENRTRLRFRFTTNRLSCLSSVQSGHQKRTQRFEKRDPWWRHIHEPWIAEGKPSLGGFFSCYFDT